MLIRMNADQWCKQSRAYTKYAQCPTSNVSHSVHIMAADGNANARYPGHPFNACKDLGGTHCDTSAGRASAQRRHNADLQKAQQVVMPHICDGVSRFDVSKPICRLRMGMHIATGLTKLRAQHARCERMRLVRCEAVFQ